MELYFDPLYQDVIHLMVNYKNTTKGGYTRALGVLFIKRASYLRVATLPCTGTEIWLDVLHYTSPSQNPYHSKKYFDGSNVRNVQRGDIPKIDNY